MDKKMTRTVVFVFFFITAVFYNTSVFANETAEPDLQQKTAIESTAAVSVFESGDGTEQAPYEIKNIDQLKDIANGLNKYYILKSDLDLKGVEMTPFGSLEKPFQGVFDGNGHTISNLKITSIESPTGMFACNEGTIRNLGIYQATISAKTTSNGAVGVLTGTNKGSIDSCYVTADLTASATGEYCYIGAMAGDNQGSITNAYSIGSYKGADADHGIYIGGVAGNNNGGMIKNVYSISSLSAGEAKKVYKGSIVGNNDGTMMNCYYLTAALGKGEKSTAKAININAAQKGESFSGFDFGKQWTMEGSATYQLPEIKGLSMIYKTTPNVELKINGSKDIGCELRAEINEPSRKGTLISYAWNDGDKTVSTEASYKLTTGDSAKFLTVTASGFDSAEGWIKDTKVQVKRETDVPNTRASTNSKLENLNTKEVPEGYIGVYTAEDLNEIRNDLTGKYILMNDIVFAESDFTEAGSYYNDGSGWSPIGADVAKNFQGVFDGNGHTIKGLYSDTEEKYAGLFGYNAGKIENLGIIKGSFHDKKKYSSVGSIAGYNSGDITNCYNEASVKGNHSAAGGIVGENGGTINNCYNKANLYAAGIAGENNGTIAYSYNLGRVTYGDAYYTGGISFKNSGTIEKCYNAGTIGNGDDPDESIYTGGGLVGINEESGDIKSCYNIGTIRGSYNSDSVGGLAGTNEGNIKNSYNTGSMRGSYTGGITGNNEGTIANCYYLELEKKAAEKSEANAIETNVKSLTKEQLKSESSFDGFDFNDTWVLSKSSTYLFPQLKELEHIGLSENHTDFVRGAGTADNPYVVSTKKQLNNVRNHTGAFYALDNDIIFDKEDFAEGGAFYNEGQGWIPIHEEDSYGFYGVFDGGKHTINGLYIKTKKLRAGLFGNNTGMIRNLGLNLGSVSNEGSNTGGISGENYGTIESCHNTLQIRGDNFSQGGISGENYGTIKNCYNTGSISGGASYTGGIAGTNSGTIKQCYNTGKMSIYKTGGITGYNTNLIENCYYLDTVKQAVNQSSNSASITNVKSLSPVSMKSKENFDGFDFKNVWVLAPDSNYMLPYLEGMELSGEGADIKLSEKTITINKGEACRLSAFLPDQMLSDVVMWSSSNNNVAAITRESETNGNDVVFVTGAAAGDATIMAETAFREQYASCKIRVTQSLSACSIAASGDATYNGTAQKQNFIIKDGAIILEEGTDYTVEYFNNVNAGTATARITGKGNYQGEMSRTFAIKAADINEEKINLSETSYTCDGKPKSPKVTIAGLKEGTDYQVSYTNNVEAGMATVVITGKGNYQGKITKSFTIKKPSLAAPKTVTASLYGYDDIKVTWTNVAGATGYKVYYKKSTSKSYSYLGATAKSYVQKSNLADGVKYCFKVYPYVKANETIYMSDKYKTSSYIYTLKKLNKPKLKKASKAYVYVSWNNISGESGYQIARSKYKTKQFSVIKTASYKYSRAKVKTTRNRTYYYKVRAYKVVGKTKIYGPWSTVSGYKLR